jgi:hypothetical protein
MVVIVIVIVTVGRRDRSYRRRGRRQLRRGHLDVFVVRPMSAVRLDMFVMVVLVAAVVMVVVVPAMVMVMVMATMAVVMVVIVVMAVLVMMVVRLVTGGRLLPGGLPQHSGPDQDNRQQRQARRQDKWVKHGLEHGAEHGRVQEIQRHTDAGERPGEADHAQLIEVIRVGFVRVVVMMLVAHRNYLPARDESISVGRKYSPSFYNR